MFSKQKFLLLSFFAAALGVMLLPLLHCNHYSSASYHKFLGTDEFKNSSREAQIKKCADCHKQEYENEMKGPHAHAYQSLMKLKAFINSDKYDCDFYTKEVNESFIHCLACHTPQNLYETSLYDSLNKPLQFAAKLLAEPHPSPLTRVSESSRTTSIDCISCHFDGKKMVSLKHVFKASDSIAALQTLPELTENNLNCYLCHFDVVRNFNPSIAIKRTGSALCVNCHQQYNAQGKATHYFYWQHDAEGKQNPKPSLLIDDFHFSVGANQKTGVITWNNTVMPHQISPGPEMILFCEVLDKDSQVLGEKAIYINKKKDFDQEMYANLGNHTLLGTLGDNVPLDGKPIQYQFPLKSAKKATTFKVSFIHKSQYWFPDSLGVLTTVKVFPVSR